VLIAARSLAEYSARAKAPELEEEKEKGKGKGLLCIM